MFFTYWTPLGKSEGVSGPGYVRRQWQFQALYGIDNGCYKEAKFAVSPVETKKGVRKDTETLESGGVKGHLQSRVL